MSLIEDSLFEHFYLVYTQFRVATVILCLLLFRQVLLKGDVPSEEAGFHQFLIKRATTRRVTTAIRGRERQQTGTQSCN